MAYLKEAQKRDFINQMAIIIQESFDLLNEHGFDPTDRINILQAALKEAREAEGEQIDAAARLKDATRKSQEKLSVAYKEASKTVDLMSGLLGKDYPLVQQIRKMRK